MTDGFAKTWFLNKVPILINVKRKQIAIIIIKMESNGLLKAIYDIGIKL